MQLRAEFTFNESTRLCGYPSCPRRSMHKLMSEFLARWPETPWPSDPKIIITFLADSFSSNSRQADGVTGVVVWLDTEVEITSPPDLRHS